MNKQQLHQQVIDELARPNITRVEADEIFEKKDKLIPPRLYKYFAPTVCSLDSVKKDSVWVCSPYDFNDPFDSALTAKLNMSEGLEELAKKLFAEDGRRTAEEAKKATAVILQIAAEREKGIVADFSSTMRSALKVTCFSETPNSLLMWGHYTDKHKGFVVEYGMTAWTGSRFGPLRKQLYPVVYRSEMFDAASFLTLDNPDAAAKSIYFGIAAACNKAADWAYESEWRLIIAHGAMEHDGHVCSPGIRRVILGAKMDPAFKKSLRDMLDGMNIPYVDASLAHGSFEIVIPDN